MKPAEHPTPARPGERQGRGVDVDESPIARLRTAASRLDLDLDDDVSAAMVALLDRVALSRQNLTAITDTWDGVDRHLADSLAGARLPEIRDAKSLIDIGSGAGFPGIVLAMALPQLEVTLLESERRKAEWLQRASADVTNVRAVHERSERVARSDREAWDVAVLRAVAEPPAALELAAPLVARGGSVVLWTGPRDEVAEQRAALASAELGLEPARVESVPSVPGAERHLQIFRKLAPTPAKFPRRPGRATSRPLA